MMNEPKSARELLEEATTMIALPVAVIGDEQITGWTKNSEWEERGFYAEGKEVKVIDPGVAQPSKAAKGFLNVKQVCSIGAIALADLTNEGLRFKSEGWTGWDIQVGVNPQVALATVALAKTILDSWTDRDRYGEYWIRNTLSAHVRAMTGWEQAPQAIRDLHGDEAAITAFLKKVGDLAIGPLSAIVKATKEEPVLVETLARSWASIITGWNDDDDRTLFEVIDMFQKATKNLIEAEAEL